MTTQQSIMLIAAVAPCLIGLWDGLQFVWRDLRARYRAKRVVFPPRKTMEVHLGDSIPF